MRLVAFKPTVAIHYSWLRDGGALVQPGTYFYHGHFGCQRAAGFYGPLIVDLPKDKHEPFTYDGEHMIILNDWWHRSIVGQEQGLESINFAWVGEPQVWSKSRIFPFPI